MSDHSKRSAYQFKRTAGSVAFNRTTSEAMQLALAKKAAKKATGPLRSWWTDFAGPDASREGFNDAVKRRHAEIVLSAPDGSRSLTRVS